MTLMLRRPELVRKGTVFQLLPSSQVHFTVLVGRNIGMEATMAPCPANWNCQYPLSTSNHVKPPSREKYSRSYRLCDQLKERNLETCMHMHTPVKQNW